jgi:hypothetical protein
VDLREVAWGGTDWIYLAQDRDQWKGLVNTVMNLLVLQNFGKFLSSCATGGFSRRAQLQGVSYLAKIQSIRLVFQIIRSLLICFIY